MGEHDKPLVWLHGEVKSPPLSLLARLQAGYLLRRLQSGDRLAMPESRPMPSIGPRVHELRLRDGQLAWRILYRIDLDTIVIAAIFAKKSATTPQTEMHNARQRLAAYDAA